MPTGVQSLQPQQAQTNLLELSWKDPACPPNFLNASNIMDYFCQKENYFYDPISDNQQIRMQNQNMNITSPEVFDEMLR